MMGIAFILLHLVEISLERERELRNNAGADLEILKGGAPYRLAFWRGEGTIQILVFIKGLF